MCVCVHACVCVLTIVCMTDDLLDKCGTKLHYKKKVDIACGPVIENSASVLHDSVGFSILSLLKEGIDFVPEILF